MRTPDTKKQDAILRKLRTSRHPDEAMRGFISSFLPKPPKPTVEDSFQRFDKSKDKK